ncbi:MAG: hypothetical protein MK193_01430 [Lentisphaeria bacterium]|nr:hypothetical protein [Lentisphaeria bacterium]
MYRLTILGILLSCFTVFGNTTIKWSHIGDIETANGTMGFLLETPVGHKHELLFQNPNKTAKLQLTLEVNQWHMNFAHAKLPSSQRLEQAYIQKHFVIPQKSQWLVLVRPESWSFYCNENFAFSIPNYFTEGAVVATSESSSSFIKSVQFMKKEEVNAFSAFVVTGEKGGALSSWLQVKGKWGLQSVLDRVMETQATARIKQRPLEAERSPNFFHLAAKDQGTIVQGKVTSHDYTVRSGILTGKGDTGLISYFQSEDNYILLKVKGMGSESLTTPLELWHISKKGDKKIKSVEIPVRHQQWIRPELKINRNRIQVFYQQVEVISLQYMDLPPGGKYGLWVNSPDYKMSFDDFEVIPADAISFSSNFAFQAFSKYLRGNFVYQPTFWQKIFEAKPRPFWPYRHSDQEQWTVWTTPGKKNSRFETTFEHLVSKQFDAAVLAKAQGPNKLGLKFAAKAEGRALHFSLDEHKGGTWHILQKRTFSMSQLSSYKSEPFVVDELTPGIIKFYLGKKLIFVEEIPTPNEGFHGIYIPSKSTAHLKKIEITFTEDTQFKNKYEKNTAFIQDPFMKNWSSPEGEWVPNEKRNQFLHKSDFLGAFAVHMPLVDQLKLVLGPQTEDNKFEYMLTQTISANNEGKSLSYKLRNTDGKILQEFDAGKVSGLEQLSFNYEQGITWIKLNNKFLTIYTMQEALKSNQVRIDNITKEQIGKVRTERSNVKDFLFKSAPFEWQERGGTWHVTNRFQCDPRWSHLNGENLDSIAGLWSNFEIEGDFSFEVYAGIKHGFYENLGRDINLTVMNTYQRPGSGYTITCTGWDDENSQMFTRLYKDGVEVAKTESYTIPQLRAGNNRKDYEKWLINSGRDIHGAWYYLKLRRVADQLEFWFDNQKVITWKDEKPIQLGSFGLWLYKSSVMYARAKISAEKINAPKQLELAQAAYKEVEAKDEHKVPYTYGKIEPDFLANQQWEVRKDHSYSSLMYEHSPKGTQATMFNRLGGGQYFMEYEGELIPYNDVRGIDFEYKQSPGTAINFYYEIGHMKGGKFNPIQKYQVNMNHGYNWAKGYQQVQHLEVSKTNDWQSLYITFPIDAPKGISPRTLMVRLIGFGNLSRGPIAQELEGNPKGASYSVRSMTPRLASKPQLTPKALSLGASKFLLMDGETQKVLRRTNSVTKMNQEILNTKGTGLKHLIIRNIRSGIKYFDLPLRWMEETEYDLALSWNKNANHYVLLTLKASPQTLSKAPSVKIAEKDVQVQQSSPNSWAVFLPETIETDEQGKIELVVSIGNKKIKKILSLHDRPTNRGPTLKAIHSDQLFFHQPATFSTIKLGENILNETAFVRYSQSGGKNIRIVLNNKQLNPWTYKWMSLKYRATEAMMFSVNANNLSQSSFNNPIRTFENFQIKEYESYIPIKTEPYEKLINGTADWQYGLFDMQPNSSKVPFNVNKDPKTQLFLNTKNSGKNSFLDIARIIYSPVLKEEEPLSFTPSFYDLDGVATIKFAIVPFKDNKIPKVGLIEDWENSENNKPIQRKLTPGDYYVFFKALDSTEEESEIVSFPISVQQNFREAFISMTNSRDFNFNYSKLNYTLVKDGQSGLSLKDFEVYIDQERVSPQFTPGSTVVRSTQSDTIELNWVYSARKYLNQVKDGQEITLHVKNAKDLTGNPIPDTVSKFKVKFANDKFPPSFAKLKLNPSHYPVAHIFTDPSQKGLRFSGNRNVGVKLNLEKEPHLEVKGKKSKYSIYTQIRKDLKIYPMIGISMAVTEESKKEQITFMAKVNGKVYQIPVNYNKIGNTFLKANLNFDAKKLEYQEIAFNLYDLLPEFQKKKNTCFLEYFYIQRNFSNVKSKLKIRTFYVFKDIDPDFTFKGIFYDRSGLEGVYCQSQDGSVKSKFVENKLDPMPPVIKDIKWLEVHAKDKAGNPTSPILFPYRNYKK